MNTLTNFQDFIDKFEIETTKIWDEFGSTAFGFSFEITNVDETEYLYISYDVSAHGDIPKSFYFRLETLEIISNSNIQWLAKKYFEDVVEYTFQKDFVERISIKRKAQLLKDNFRLRKMEKLNETN